ncbi:MAG: hypothetical protein ACREBU_06870 [Nitrososphaera sp.]
MNGYNGLGGGGLTTADLDTYLRAAQFETSPSVNVTGGVGGGAKGAWVQLIASTARKYNWLVVFERSGTIETYTTDIGTGAAAAEVVLIPDIEYNIVTVVGQTERFEIYKCAIASGTRISARTSTPGGGSDIIVVGIIGIG